MPTARRFMAKGAIIDAARSLADDFKTSGGALQATISTSAQRLSRDDPAKDQSLGLTQLDADIRGTINPARVIYVTAGEAKLIGRSLTRSGFPSR